MTLPGARLGFAKLPGGEATTNSQKLDIYVAEGCMHCAGSHANTSLEPADAAARLLRTVKTHLDL